MGMGEGGGTLACQINPEEWVPEYAGVLQNPLGTAKQLSRGRTRVPFGVNTVVLPGRWEVSPGVPHTPRTPQFLRSPFPPSPDFLHLPNFCSIGTAYQNQLSIPSNTFPCSKPRARAST